MSDDYEPALDMAADAADGSADPNDAPATAEPKDAANAPPVEPRGGPHVMSDTVRKMFRDLAARVAKEGLETDDLVPVDHESPPAAAGVAAAGASHTSPVTSSSPAAAAAAPSPAPAPVPPVARPSAAQDAAAIAQRAASERAERERASGLADREAKIAAREAELEARAKAMPSRTDLIERPGATLMQFIRDTYGTADDNELKDALTDIVSELSEAGLGVKLPTEFRTGMESRKALRSVKAYKAELTRDQQRIADERAAAQKAADEQRAAAEQAAREREAVATVNRLVAGVKDTHPFLHEQDNPGDIVVEVIREQLKRGEPADWQAAAKLADDYYKAQAEEAVKKATRLQSLLAPAKPAPATATASPGAAPGPAATPQPKPAPTTTAIDEDSSQPMDRHERRAQNARALLRKHFRNADA